MANPQKEHGYTAIANELVEILCGIDIPGSHLRVLLAIFRKTYGYSKKSDSISLSQFKALTGLSNRTIIRCTQDLEAKKMIFIDRVFANGGKISNVYHFIKDYEKWEIKGTSNQTKKSRQGKKDKREKREVVTVVSLGGGSDTEQGGSDTERQKVVTPNAKKVQTVSHTKVQENNSIQKQSKGGKIGKKEKEQSALIPDVIFLFVKFNPSCKKFYNNTVQRQACQDLLDEYGFEQVRKVINSLPISNKISYFPIIATPLQLWHNYQKLQDKWVQYKTKNKSKHNEPNYIL